MRIAGGHSDSKPATKELTDLVSPLQASIECQLNETFSQFDAIEYRVQVVAGCEILAGSAAGSFTESDLQSS